jgi:hypothetical protein
MVITTNSTTLKHLSGIKALVDTPLIDNVTTSTNEYVNIGTWDTKWFPTKRIVFTATTNNLKFKILGSLDNGATFPHTVESEFTVIVGSITIKTIPDHWDALKVQVKPAVNDTHGTSVLTASASSSPPPASIENAEATIVGAGVGSLQITGNAQLAITGTAQQLSATSKRYARLFLFPGSNNSADVYVGKSGVTTSTGILVPDMAMMPPLENVDISEVYAVGTAGSDTLTWIGLEAV